VHGNFQRLLIEGEYNFTFNAPGYYPVEINNISVYNRERTDVNVEMVTGDLIADFYANETILPIESEVQFFDESYGNIVSWSWTFEGGEPATSTEQNPIVDYNYAGVFMVSLTVSDGQQQSTVTKPAYITVNQEFIMSDNVISTCGGIFYDSGGNNSNYDDDEDYTLTFNPDEDGNKLKISFLMFNVEDDSGCDYDWLKIYDGPDVSSSLIGTFCGTNSPGEILATNEEGALTFQFHSDSYINESGWTALIECDSNVGEQEIKLNEIQIFPNPVSDRMYINMPSGYEGKFKCSIYNSSGMLISESVLDQNSPEIDLKDESFIDGVYYIVIQSRKQVYTKRFIITNK